MPLYPSDWIPRLSTWTDARHGWTWRDFDSTLAATGDGGRSWNAIFTGSNYLFNPGFLKTSRSAGIVATGRIDGGAFWTNDGGRRWFGGAVPLQSAAAGRGSLLFWHSYVEAPGTLYRVAGWPPRGNFPCLPGEDWPPNQPPGHRVCGEAPRDAGMRSVPVARLDRGSFGAMRPVPGGVAALVADPQHSLAGLDATDVAVYRAGALSLAPLPAPALKTGEIFSGAAELAAAWPSLFVTAPLSLPNDPYRPRRIGMVLWRSGNGGKTWTVRVSRTLPKRAARARGRVWISARLWLPGGFVASARAGTKKVLLVRQLGRTRLLMLPGSARCSALSPRVDWPFLAIEGRRRGSTLSIWWSANGGSHWTQLGRC